MPAGLPYFAWIDPGETTFTSGHMRWDEAIFSFTLSQSEGDPANLTAVVRRPRNSSGDAIGLLGPGRKIWCWFALDCGPSLIKFRGRLVGIPTSIFEELVTLEFVARPIDVVAQKEALAASLRVLPFYDEAVVDPSKRTDPEVVLEGYTAIWHYDRETHALTVSDEINGDSTVTFDGGSDDGKVLYDGLSLTLTTGPLARVDLTAEYTWTQQARGDVDLTGYLLGHWPDAQGNAITSFSLTSAGWPKNGASLGEGWEVTSATADDVYDLTVKTYTTASDSTIVNPVTKESSGNQSSITRSFMNQVPPGSIQYPAMVTSKKTTATWEGHDPFGGGLPDTVEMTSFSYNYSSVSAVLPLNYTAVTLVAGYKAERQFTERVSFSLFANVQNILTDPEDGEALRVDDIKSVNLSEELFIGDARRRSYIATDRGNQSLQYLIARARAHLVKRARVVEIAFAPKLARMPEITLRQSCFLAEPRVGEAFGKIIGYSVSLDGSDGTVKCEVRIGCTIGRGGLATSTTGTPTYCSTSYTGYDYQQFINRTILVDAFADSSVGYAPPNADPNDDGVDFLSGVGVDSVIDSGLVVENPASVQRPHLLATTGWPTVAVGAGIFLAHPDVEQRLVQESLAARSEAINNALKEVETSATFRLKSMTREFSTDYAVAVTDLMIPTGYDLEAA
jgi:hypothetical protein